jgi:pilus assembly protein CpaE
MIDLQPSFGDAAVLLSAEPRFSVYDALENTHRLDQSFFEGLAVRTDAGPWLLASPDHISSHTTDATRLRLLLEFAARHYRYTVLDVPRTARAALEALTVATTVVVVTTQELASVRSASRLADMLRRRYGREKVAVVLSRQDPQSEINLDDIEMAVHGEVRFTFPSDYRTAVDAINLGRPLALAPGSALSDAIARFTSTLMGHAPRADAPAAPVHINGLLSRLSSLRWNPS